MSVKLFRSILVLCILCFTFNLHAQEVIKQESCDTNPFRNEIDSLKNVFSSQGYIVLREASMAMQSEYEMPIVVPMNQGSLYQFVFIGDPSSRLYEVRMYDWNENKWCTKKINGAMLTEISSATLMFRSFQNTT
ncbi:MAG TPA: hypothetical protein VK787_07500 [Puia sp.]|nr:hypothetical protein [Puia sp.]